MNNIVNRRRALDAKPEPQDIVTVYNYTKTIAAGSGKVAVIYFSFKANAIYEFEATADNVSGNWRIDFLGSGAATILSGQKNNYTGSPIHFTCRFDDPPNRFNVYIANSAGHTANVKLTETIPAS